MVTLNVARINISSPYPIEEVGNGYYSFDTDHDVKYTIKFKEDFILSTENSYEFVLINTNNGKSPLDKKLRNTIAAIILDFFQDHKRTMLYVCSTSDGKQKARNRLFKAWFDSEQNKEEFIFSHYELKDTDGIWNFAAIITRYDNPEFVQVMAELKETLMLLRSKPEDSQG